MGMGVSKGLKVNLRNKEKSLKLLSEGLF